MPSPPSDPFALLSLVVPAGYAFHLSPPRVFPDDLYDRLLIWEPPRKDQLYIASVDVGDGIGQDRSVVDVTRVGTLKEPDEQVAQFVSAWTDPIGLAPIVDAIGRLYTGSDGLEALCAVETNNHGIATNMELQRHLGYSNLYQWQVLDSAEVEKAPRQTIGWSTNQRTRPIMLALFLRKLKTTDPVTGLPDYRINSPLTLEELRNFQTLGGIREAQADPTNPNAHDDCIMAGAIGVQVSNIIQLDTTEPVDQARRRLSEEKCRRESADKHKEEGRDYINQDFTAEEAAGWQPQARVEDFCNDDW